MIITRWQAPVSPTAAQIKMMLETEGLEAFTELYSPTEKISEHRHPYTEVRYVVSGELMFNIAGNQFLLRAGDRVEVPANTKHSHFAGNNDPCSCVCAQKLF